MNISKDWLLEHRACTKGINWFTAQTETDGLATVKKLMAEKKLEWANWTIVQVMTYRQYVSYGVYAAEQVIDIYKKKYPDDDAPRTAIETAKKCIENPNNENKIAASEASRAASWAARAASEASRAASRAAGAASEASEAASRAARAAGEAARTASWTASWAARAASRAAGAASEASEAANWAARAASRAAGEAASSDMLTKILKHGIGLLTSDNGIKIKDLINETRIRF